MSHEEGYRTADSLVCVWVCGGASSVRVGVVNGSSDLAAAEGTATTADGWFALCGFLGERGSQGNRSQEGKCKKGGELHVGRVRGERWCEGNWDVFSNEQRRTVVKEDDGKLERYHSPTCRLLFIFYTSCHHSLTDSSVCPTAAACSAKCGSENQGPGQASTPHNTKSVCCLSDYA